MTDIPTDAEIARSRAFADDLLDDVLNAVDDKNEDPIGVIFSMWIMMTHILAHRGWSADELTREVVHHVALAMTEGSA